MESPEVLKKFLELAHAKEKPRVLEIGTRQVDSSPGTIRRHWVPNAKEYIGTDFQAGPDVDVVSDIHSLSNTFGENRFDVVISCSVYEHVRNPWLATTEISRILRPGGIVFISTHNAFPLHAHPHDYWRYTRESLAILFGDDAGFNCLQSEYQYPCKIVSEDDPGTSLGEAYLLVMLLAEKVAQPCKNVYTQGRKPGGSILSRIAGKLGL